MQTPFAGDFPDGNFEHGSAADTICISKTLQECYSLLAKAKMGRLFHAYIAAN